jgi:hypothetical protein
MFPPATDSWAKCYEVNNITSQPVIQRTALERRLMGLASEPKGPTRGSVSADPTGATSSSTSSSSGLARYLSNASGPKRLSLGPPSDTSPLHLLPPSPKLSTKISENSIPLHMNCEQKFQKATEIEKRIIWGDVSVMNAMVGGEQRGE